MHLFALIALLSAAPLEPHCPSTYAWPEPVAPRSISEFLPTLTLSVTTAHEAQQRLDEQARDAMASPGLLTQARALNQANERRPTAWLLSATWRGLRRRDEPIARQLDSTPDPLPQLDACLLLIELNRPAGYALLEPEAAIDRWLEVQTLRAFITDHATRGGAR